MRLIPKKFAALAKLASTDKSRGAYTGIYYQPGPGGVTTLAATNGKALIEVTLPEGCSPSDFPDHPAIDKSKPDVNAVIPATAWTAAHAAFKTIAKKSPVTDCLAVQTDTDPNGTGPVTLARTDLETWVVSTPTAMGPCAKYQDILNRVTRGADDPRKTRGVTIYLDAHLLISVLNVMAALGNTVQGFFPIRLDVSRDAMNPIRLTALGQDGEHISCLVMPMRGQAIKTEPDLPAPAPERKEEPHAGATTGAGDVLAGPGVEPAQGPLPGDAQQSA